MGVCHNCGRSPCVTKTRCIHCKRYQQKYQKSARGRKVGHRASRKYRASPHGQGVTKAKRDRLNQERRLLLDRLKSVPCADCGNRFPACCMDFDHVVGEKSFPIGPNKNIGIERLLEEIKKCVVVCANCHRIRTTDRLYVKFSTLSHSSRRMANSAR